MKNTIFLISGIILIVIVIFFVIYQLNTDPNALKSNMNYEKAAQIYKDNCARCHGFQGEGFASNPQISDSDLSIEEIKSLIQNGSASMPAFSNIREQKLSELAKYVATL